MHNKGGQSAAFVTLKIKYYEKIIYTHAWALSSIRATKTGALYMGISLGI